MRVFGPKWAADSCVATTTTMTKKSTCSYRYIKLEVINSSSKTKQHQWQQQKAKYHKHINCIHIQYQPVECRECYWTHTLKTRSKKINHTFFAARHCAANANANALLMRKYFIQFYVCNAREFILHFKCHTRNRMNTINGNGRNTTHKCSQKNASTHW